VATPIRQSVLAWFLLAGYCLLIFIQSSFATPDMGPDLPLQDKAAHLAAYALMGYLACRAWASLPWHLGGFAISMAGFLFAVVFGLSDEWHQSFVPGRMADGWDVLADGLGALTGVGIHAWRHYGRAASDDAFPR
jgi:VanZ family protein